MASKGNKAVQLLDACCGVGTILLEACFSGFKIDGCDVNWKASKNTRKNLAHYNYSADVYHCDIRDLHRKYDAIIIDLPYNLYTRSEDAVTLNIIESAAKLSKRLVIVSVADIEKTIWESGFEIIDFCKVEKRRKSKFIRCVWVCEKSGSSVS